MQIKCNIKNKIMFEYLNLFLFPVKVLSLKKFELAVLKSSLLSISTIFVIFRLLAKSKAVMPLSFMILQSAPFKISLRTNFDFSKIFKKNCKYKVFFLNYSLYKSNSK